MWHHRSNLTIGFLLMLVSRVAGLVLPTTSKYFIDNVVGKHQSNLLPWLALAGGCATIIQSGTSFTLSQVISVTAQKAITDMRNSVMHRVARLPVRYFDFDPNRHLDFAHPMNDAEGIRNLRWHRHHRTGRRIVLRGHRDGRPVLPELAVDLGDFGGAGGVWRGNGDGASPRVRPLFRDRGKITAEITGRLAETLGGIRIVKAYTAENTRRIGVRQGRPQAVSEHRQVDQWGLGDLGVFRARDRCGGRAHADRRRTFDYQRPDDAGAASSWRIFSLSAW